MDAAEHEEIESSARAAFDRRDSAEAAAAIVRGHGPEIYGFLLATHRTQHDADDVFSDFALGLVKGLPSFRSDSSFRTWAYVIARSASSHFHRDSARARKRHAGSSAIEKLAARVRTSTASFLRTENRSRLERLRDSLAPEDRELLVLRVDRRFSCEEVALAFHEGDEPMDEAERAQAEQRLRVALGNADFSRSRFLFAGSTSSEVHAMALGASERR